MSDDTRLTGEAEVHQLRQQQLMRTRHPSAPGSFRAARGAIPYNPDAPSLRSEDARVERLQDALRQCLATIQALRAPCRCDPPGSGAGCNGVCEIRALLVRQTTDQRLAGRDIGEIFDAAVAQIIQAMRAPGVHPALSVDPLRIPVSSADILAWTVRLTELMHTDRLGADDFETIEELRDFLDDTYRTGARLR